MLGCFSKLRVAAVDSMTVYFTLFSSLKIQHILNIKPNEVNVWDYVISLNKLKCHFESNPLNYDLIGCHINA